MIPINIKFQAFIPNSLGKPLLSYFESTSHFRLLSNKEEFTIKLRQLDGKGYTWLPEPGGFMTKNFFATDNVEMFHHHSEHSTRLAIQAEINPSKIGDLRRTDKIFKHDSHEDYGGANSQHSGESHQAQAYIKRIPFYTDMPRASIKDIYVGVCSESNTKRSAEDPLEFSIRNSKKQFYTEGGNDTTEITVSSSAEYPFLELVAPNIDFELKIELYKNIQNNRIDINIGGWHNDFPAYELIINQSLAYLYNPADYGHTGPSLINLNTKKHFNHTKWITLSDWEVRDLRQEKRFGW